MEVDISEVLALDRRAGQLLETKPNDELIRVTEKAVQIERKTHEYRNITGRLQMSTVAKVISGPDPAINDVVMGMDYASHVRMRARTDIDTHVANAAKEYEYFADGIAFELSKM